MKRVQIRSYFWSVFSCIWIEYGDLLHKSQYSNQIQVNSGNSGNFKVILSFRKLLQNRILLSKRSGIYLGKFYKVTLRKKCPHKELFLICIFPHSALIWSDTSYLLVFSPNVGKYRPEKTPYLDIFHTVCLVPT